MVATATILHSMRSMSVARVDLHQRDKHDKMLMEEMLNSITWTSTGAGQTDIFLNFLAVCDSA